MGMFDDIELPTNDKQVKEPITPNEQRQGSEGEIPPENFLYLEKTLQIQMNFTAINERYDVLMKKLDTVENKLEGYKDMQVSLSSADAAILRELPKSLSSAVIRQVNDAATIIKEDITNHANSTMKGLDNACNAKIAETKRSWEQARAFIYLGGTFGQW